MSSVVEQIVANLVQTLGAIEGINAQRIGDVKLTSAGTVQSITHGMCVVLPDEAHLLSSTADLVGPFSKQMPIDWSLDVDLLVFARVSDNSETPADQTLIGWHADIFKALNVDRSRGKVAKTTLVGDFALDPLDKFLHMPMTIPFSTVGFDLNQPHR